MFRRHYSDERLLAHLDGEVPGWKRGRLEAHLLTCWTCRARRAALEQQIRKIAEAFDEPEFPDEGWPARQIERFRRLAGYQECTPAPVTVTRALRSFRPLYWAGAAAAALIAFLVFQSARPDRPESAARAVAAATQVESAAAKQPVHQSFRVELLRGDGRRNLETGQLEIWSDPAGGRYSARWLNGGRLVFAAWKPKLGQEYWHGAPAPVTVPLRLASVTTRPASAADLEGLLVRWLASLQWRPVSIAEEVSYFISQSGVTLRVERFQAGGEPYLRITGLRRVGNSSAVLTAELALTGHRPRLLHLRLEDGGGAVEIRLAAERVEIGPGVKFPAAVFEPDTDYVHLPSQERASPPGLTKRPVEPVVSPASAAPDVPSHEIAGREVEVRYALHRIGTCLGEPIEVEVSADGQVTVRGLADQESRREAIRETLQGLAYVRVEVRTVAEALAGRDTSAVGTASETVPARRELIAGGKPIIEERLAAYFRQSLPEGEIPRKIAAVSNDATAATAELLAHAWAVRRLRGAYPLERIAQLRPQSRWILEDMLQGHLAALQEAARAALGLLEPILGEAVRPAESEAPEAGLEEAFEDLFELAAAADRLSRGVFALIRLDEREEPLAPSLLIRNLARLRRDAAAVRDRAAAEFREAAVPRKSSVARRDAPLDPKER